jgi:mannose-6-phosphate isomerase-like protein (cupin superfamily)
MNTVKVAVLLLGVMALAWLVAFVIDRARPEPQVPEALYPSPGQVIHSHSEGFTSRIVKVDGERVWIEATLAPHAPGPPPHVHRTFAEDFYVAKGRLSLRVGNDVKTLQKGESFKVPAGIAHQPFNATDEEVVLRGPLTPEYALPRDFVLFLSQMYEFVDESPAHARPPAILFQMSIFSPRYDAWLAAPPVFVQRAQSVILRPIARMLGYRSYYERFISHTGPHFAETMGSQLSAR